MATIIQVRRVSNPRGRTGGKRRRNRNLSPRQVRYFGTKAQKAALKRRRNSGGGRGTRRRNIAAGFYNATGFHPLRRSADYDPDRAGDDYGSRTDGAGFKTRKRRAKKGARPRAKARRKKNPALVVTLGAGNPRRSTVARRKSHARRRNRRPRVTVRRRRRVAMNPRRRRARRSNRRRRAKVVYVARNPRRRRSRARRSNPRRRRGFARRRNPMGSLFGASITSKRGMTLIGGGITGVVAAKFIPTMLPLNMLGSIAQSAIGKVLVTGGSAVIAGWAASKFMGGDFGEGVLFGGLMQTASVAINQFFPGIYSQLGIGLGDLVPGQYSVPQNPIRGAIPPPAPPNQRVAMGGLARAYGGAY